MNGDPWTYAIQAREYPITALPGEESTRYRSVLEHVRDQRRLVRLTGLFRAAQVPLPAMNDPWGVAIVSALMPARHAREDE